MKIAQKSFLLLIITLLYATKLWAVEGKVHQVAGDLIYITGLNGSAPLWSTLTVANSTVGEVIKELPNMLVARLTDPNGINVKSGDIVTIKNKGTSTSTRRAKRIVYATRVDKGPPIDGNLDDPVWSQAIPIEGFVQRDPNYWMPDSDQTTARILYDDTSIYFSFNCPTSDAVSGHVANNMRRDSELWGDDNIQIILDTYNDRQNGFFFFVNPLGAQSDLLLSNEGRSYNSDWDCNWVSRTGRTANKWTAEVAIPFNQLRFKQTDDMVWGINLSRYKARKNHAMQLVVGEQSSSTSERYLMTEIGELRGLKQIRARRPIQIKPYVLSGTSKNFLTTNPKEDPTLESGLDLRYGITSNLTLDMSYNTDFAQVEGDQEQANLTQFKLFFPEKREFFLEGANLFDFGEPAIRRGSGSTPPTLLFYSRQIGLEGGQKTPILLGSKIAGKEGRTSIGALNVLTDPTSFTDTNNNTVDISRTNYSVFRVKRDVLTRSNVGFIVVNKQTNDPVDGWDSYNRSLGIDFSYSPTSKLNIQAFTARTWDSQLDVAGNASFAFLNYRGGKFWTRLKFLDVQEHFEPAVGFVNRRKGLVGLRRYDLYARWRPKPNFGNVRYMSIGPEFKLFTDRNNKAKYWEAEVSWYTLFNGGDAWSSQITRFYDVVDKPFTPSDRRLDVVIPPGTYKFTTIRTGPRPSGSRRIRPEFRFEAGTYYTGRRYTLETESAFRPSGRIALEVIYEGNWLRLPQDNLSIHTLSSRLLYSFTTDFFVKLFVQWNNDDESAGANLLLNYRYRPGSNIFLVLDSGYNTAPTFTRRNRTALLKWSYLFNM